MHDKGTQVLRDLKVENRQNTTLSGIGRFCHIGYGFLKFSLILYNSDKKVCEKVV